MLAEAVMVYKEKSFGHVVWVCCKLPINLVLVFEVKYITLPEWDLIGEATIYTAQHLLPDGQHVEWPIFATFVEQQSQHFRPLICCSTYVELCIIGNKSLSKTEPIS